MPRRGRVEVEGGVYHVYNRVASGEGVFLDPEEALGFVERIREVKARDGWTVFAWALLSNHFHLAVRTSTVTLGTSMHSLQGQYSRAFNRRWSRTGGLWQSRYHAKLVDEQRYLSQVILYIHLNPVRAGLVDEPAGYAFSGHSEIVKSPRKPLVDIDQALLCFGDTRRTARRAYSSAIRAGIGDDDTATGSTTRWWESIPQNDEELEPDTGVLPGSRSGGVGWKPAASQLVEASCRILEVTPTHLNSKTRDRTTAKQRRLVGVVLLERWGQKTRDLAVALDRNPEVVSHWVSEGRRRANEPEFARQVEELDLALRVWLEGQTP